MIYELSTNGDTVGYFPTEAGALHAAAYMPAGRYTVTEWDDDGEFLVRNRQTGRVIQFNND